MLSPLLKYFKELTLGEIEEYVPADNHLEIANLIVEIKSIEFDVKLRPILNEMKKIETFELEKKKQFLCALCDFKNHEHINQEDQKILI